MENNTHCILDVPQFLPFTVLLQSKHLAIFFTYPYSTNYLFRSYVPVARRQSHASTFFYTSGNYQKQRSSMTASKYNSKQCQYHRHSNIFYNAKQNRVNFILYIRIRIAWGKKNLKIIKFNNQPNLLSPTSTCPLNTSRNGVPESMEVLERLS